MNAHFGNSLVWLLLLVLSAVATGQEAERPRLRDLGIRVGELDCGPFNAITDVAGVRVGHTTIVDGEGIRTGVTAILPHPGNLFQQKVRAGVCVANAFGKAAGLLQVQELGTIETPIVLTNTLNVGTAMEAVVNWTLHQPGNETVRSVNAVVGETNDGFLNDIRGQHVTEQHVVAAIQNAQEGVVAEGSVGAGTGTMALGFKGGIGTASRRLGDKLGGYTVGALVQTNFGGNLMIAGVPVGQRLKERRAGEPASLPNDPTQEFGSIMIILATDAPLSDRNLNRLAFRAVGGLARTGANLSNGSGDFVIAFSTANLVADAPKDSVTQLTELPNERMSPLFQAAMESVEEAILNSLLKATTVQGNNGHIGRAISIEHLREVITKVQPELIEK